MIRSLSTFRRVSLCLRQVPNVHIAKRSFAVITEKLESLGDSITTAVVLNWSKEPGDSIKEDDVITTVETDKVTMDIRAKKAGVFLEKLVPAGTEVSVGADLYRLDTSATSLPPLNSEATVPKSSERASPAAVAPAASGARIEISVPAMGESITQGVLGKWLIKTGESVSVDQVVAMIETDKVTVEVRSTHSGVISETFAEEGAEVNVGDRLFAITEGAVAPKSAVSAPVPKGAPVVEAKPAIPAATKPAETPKPPAKPAAKSSSPDGVKSSPGVSSSGSNIGEVGANRAESRVKMTRMRIRIAQRLKESQHTAAMLTTFQEVDMSTLIDLRNKHKEEFEKTHGVKLGFMSAFVKAATNSLREIPAVNAVIDDSTQEIVYRNYVDISVAVAAPTGLVVPVLRNTESMTFADVEKSINFYSKKAKEGALALEDMSGGTFTISNGGVFGSLFGTPIINPPQSAILGMHATKLRPTVINGKVEARPMMYLALTYDHRLIDGREAVTFLKSIQAKIEDPHRLLLDL